MSPPLPLSSPRLARMSAEPVPAAFQLLSSLHFYSLGEVFSFFLPFFLLDFVNSLNNYGDDNDDDDDDDDDDFSEEGEFFEEEFEEDDDANSYEFVTPISHHYFYRAFLIAALPQITTLDGVLITKEEQEVIKPILPHIECLNTSTDWQRNAAVCRRAWQTGVTHQFLRKSPQQAGPSSSGFSAKDLSHKEDVLSVEQEKEKHSVLQELSFSNSGNNGRNACVDFRMAISSSLRRVVNRPSVECFLTAHSGSRVGVPRQFEYHPRVADEMVVGTMSGDIILLNPRASSPAKRVKASWSSGVMESILGLGWLKRADNTQKFIAGSDQGAIRMMNTEQMGKGGSPVSQFEKFPKLTSLSCNSQDDCFMVSGYSKSIALYDMNTGAQTVFDDLHDKDHINVLKFANTHPSLFVTSSFDHYVKMWDLRTDLKAKKPVYSQRSENGTLMACFSDDDRYILGSAVDNEVTQVHILFYFILFYFILFYFILFYFILFYFILFYFILFYFILFYFILFYFILFYFILFYFILFYFILFYFILFYFILFYFILFYFILFYFILFYFILFYFILFYFILFYFILFYFILFYFILFYFILFYFILFYFILFYFILFYFILFYFISLHFITSSLFFPLPEQKQYHAFTGQKHFRYPLSAKGSNYNYTRSYYMQGLGGDYYTIVGSCDDNVVHIFNSETGAFFRDVELTTPTDGWDPHGLIYCQSLRGDPFVPFNLSVLVNSNHVYIPSRLLHIDLMKSDVNEERRESKEKGEEGWDESSDEEEN